MKKLIITTAIVLGLSMTTFAEGNQGGGLFHRGATPTKNGEDVNPSGMLLPGYGGTDNADADPAPLGSGIAVLTLLGGAYLVGRRRREE